MTYYDAGWRSLVTRWAHNPKIGGSSPSPATKETKISKEAKWKFDTV
ncbi:hypothetical protein GvMRE_IIg456 [endosymbiont GvMRE of Glomus versiforme]|nr:hypothetical protein GvMRE_IIg456 [endosymbiont GvMRE of Glomus versiforme]